MSKILAITLNTFKEAVRDRILYAILAFAIAMIGSAFILATLGVGSEAKIIRDIGLGFISIFGTLIAVFIGIGFGQRTLHRKNRGVGHRGGNCTKVESRK